MKKMMKKLIAMAAALVMIVTLLPAVGAKAATVNWGENASITIKKTTTTPDDALTGMGEFNIYLVARLDQGNGNQLTYTPVENAGITKAEIANLGNLTATQLEQKATDVLDILKKAGVQPINEEYLKGGDTQDIETFGLYIVDEVTAPEGYIEGAPFFVDVPRTNNNGESWDYNITVNPKNSKSDLNLKKTVDDETVEPGDTISYTIEGSLAYLSAAELEDPNAYITLTDEMSETLMIDEKYNESSPLQVRIYNKVTNKYEYVTVNIDGDRHGFTLRIEGDDLAKYNGQKFSITYDVDVADDFVTTSEANNKVTINSSGDGEPVDKDIEFIHICYWYCEDRK